jgi:glycosyltransferase involved in cell wall biosynthesis
VIVLIPAFEPAGRLVALVRDLRVADPDCQVLLVDDGSGPAYDAVFVDACAAGALLIRHPRNQGKGRALKTGFAHASRRWPGQAVVSADADGQHGVTDILRVADRVRDSSDRLVLGGRAFDGAVPARSRLGNTVARGAFRLVSGISLRDTQSGLRGFPAALVPWLLRVPGERFEYEQNMLLESRRAGFGIEEIEIETIYLERNASSHFRPLIDSVRVLLPLLAFAAVSLSSFVVDAVALQLLHAVFGSLALSVVGARLLSGSLNFALNRRLFAAGTSGGRGRHALRYVALALLLLTASYGSLHALTAAGIPLLPGKIVTDVLLYLVSYTLQKHVVFTPPIALARSGGRVDAAAGAPPMAPGAGAAAADATTVTAAGRDATTVTAAGRDATPVTAVGRDATPVGAPG